MGGPYIIITLLGCFFIGAVMLLFAIESGWKDLGPKIGCGLTFLLANVMLFLLVKGFLSGER